MCELLVERHQCREDNAGNIPAIGVIFLECGGV